GRCRISKRPSKPPVRPVKGKVGTIGVAYFRYAGGATYQAPLDGSGFPGRRVQIQGCSGCSFPYVSLSSVTKQAADGFAFRMGTAGWKVGFSKGDPASIELKRSDLNVGGSNIFNQVNLGLFLGHGAYGTSIDFTQPAGQ